MSKVKIEPAMPEGIGTIARTKFKIIKNIIIPIINSIIPIQLLTLLMKY